MLSVVFESANPSAVRRFWQRVLDYAPGEDGGLADPLRRDPARVAEDVRNGFVSREAARDDYGVVFLGGGFSVDEPATEALRGAKTG